MNAEECSVCGELIVMQCQVASGVCSQNCERARDTK